MGDLFTVKRTKDDGLGFPKPGTRVKYGSSTFANINNTFTDKIVYVCEHPPSIHDGIVIGETSGSYHGNWCTEWYEEVTIETLDDELKELLSRAALDAATKRGYCDETKNILGDIGLPRDPKVKRTLELLVREEDKVVVTVNGEVVEHNLSKPRVDAEW